MTAVGTVGIVPIKGHSERVPDKNFRILCGVPLWMYAVAALAESGVIDRIVIDTDVPDRFGKIVSAGDLVIEERDPHVCGDDVSMNEVLATVIARHPADRYVQTHATNPFLTGETIATAIERLDDGADSIYSATKRRSRFWDVIGSPINHDPGELVNTQTLDPVYEENSAFYMFTAASFKYSRTRLGDRPGPYVTTELEGFDIDYEEDWNMAKLLRIGQIFENDKKTLDLECRV